MSKQNAFYYLASTNTLKKCKCCTLELEVIDGYPLCHFCYLRECNQNPGKCANARTIKEKGE
jgi:hypothetical protein